MARRCRTRRKRSSRHRSRGGGYGDNPAHSVSPGYVIHQKYDGIGKDCTGNPMSHRPGYIDAYVPKGLPGMRGGMRLDVAMDSTAFPVTNPNLPPVSGSVTPKPSDFPATQGVAGTVVKPDMTPQKEVIAVWPGGVVPGGAATMPIAKLDASANAANLNGPGMKGGRRRSKRSKQRKHRGGRYGTFPELGPLNPSNGVGTSLAQVGRIPCERGSFDPLNSNVGNVQRLTTAPATPPYVSMRGGMAPVAPGSGGYSAANFPTVRVGDADSMRYYAPTAGYRNDFMTFRAPSAVPGLTIQTPYDARAFNQACIKTGGRRTKRHSKRHRMRHSKRHRMRHSKRHSKRHGGSHPVAEDAGKVTKLELDQVQDRYDFDFSNKGLPCKF